MSRMLLRSLSRASRLPRLAVFPVPTTSVALGRFATASLVRPISSSPLLSQAAAATADDAEHHTKHGGRHHKAATKHETQPSTVSEYVDRYGGWFPLIGLTGFIAVSKELLVLNEELLMVTNFAAFIFISWMAAGDTLLEAVKAKQEQQRKFRDDVSDMQIDSLQSLVRTAEVSLEMLPVLQRLKTVYATLGERVVKAKELKSRQAARDAVLARLNSLYQKEQADKSKYLSDTLDAVSAEVQQRMMELSTQDKEAMLNDAIHMLETGRAEQPGTDKVVLTYQEVLQRKLAEGDSGQRRAPEEEGETGTPQARVEQGM